MRAQLQRKTIEEDEACKEVRVRSSEPDSKPDDDATWWVNRLGFLPSEKMMIRKGEAPQFNVVACGYTPCIG